MSKITLYESATPAAAPPAGTVYLYPKVDGRWYFMADDGTEYPMRPIGAGTGDLLADGSVPLTANWDVGAFTITALRFVSDVPTGTAPFTVASTTLVTNLNADQLDGNEATAFGTAAQGALADTALQDVSDDLTPSLGGDLEIGANKITSTGTAIFDVVTGYSIQIGSVPAYVMTTAGLYPAADGTYDLGTNTARWDYIYTDNFTITNNLYWSSAQVVGSLGSAAVGGQITLVADALNPKFGETVVGTGSRYAVVMSDGTNWIVIGGPTAVESLDGTTLPTATVAGTDKVLIQDTDGSDAVKTVTAQAIADLGGGGAGGMTVVAVKTANYTAGEDEVVPVDSSGGSFTITMPASASAQSRVIVMDIGKACTTYPVTLGRNSQTFDGVAEDFIIDQDNGRVDAVSDGAGDFSTHLIGTPNIVYGRDTIGARVSRSTDFTGVVTSTDTPMQWTNEDMDTGGFIDLGTDNTKISIAESGWYIISAAVRWDSNSTGLRYAWFMKNGTDRLVGASQFNGDPDAANNLTAAIYLVAGDYIQLYLRQTSGANRTVDGVGTYPPYLSIIKAEAVTGSPVSGSQVKLGETTVAGAAATSMTVSGLTLTGYSKFRLVTKMRNATGSAAAISMYFNSDTTATNYHRQTFVSSHSTNTGNRGNDAVVCGLPANAQTYLESEIALGVDGKARVINQGNEDDTTSIVLRHSVIQWVTAANITGITLSSDIASSLDVGSTFTVYGVVA